MHQIPDQIDAHRLLVQVGNGRSTSSYSHNEKVFSQGDDAEFIAFVQEGSVKLTSRDDSGASHLLGIANEGQFFGEACLHNLPIRSLTATAVGCCRITTVTRYAILGAIHHRPGFATMVVDYLSAANNWVEKDLLDHLSGPEPAPGDSEEMAVSDVSLTTPCEVGRGHIREHASPFGLDYPQMDREAERRHSELAISF